MLLLESYYKLASRMPRFQITNGFTELVQLVSLIDNRFAPPDYDAGTSAVDLVGRPLEKSPYLHKLPRH